MLKCHCLSKKNNNCAWKGQNTANIAFVDGVICLIFPISFILVCSAKYLHYFRLSNRTLVEDGTSLNGTSLFEVRYDETEFSVRCILNIENRSTWLLTDPKAHSHCGYMSPQYPVPVVFPATREVLVGLKTVSNFKQYN